MNLKNRMKSDSLIREPIEKEKLPENSEQQNMKDITQKSNQLEAESIMQKQSEKIQQQKDEIQKQSEEIQKLSSENQRLSETIHSQNQTLQNLQTKIDQIAAELEQLQTNGREKDIKMIQSLSSENSILRKELQKKSETIVLLNEQIGKLSGADLVLKENEQLKEKDRQREKESNEIKRKCEAEVLAVKDEYNTQEKELSYQTDLCQLKMSELNDKIKQQDKYIRKEADILNNKYKKSCEAFFKKKTSDMKNRYTTMIAAIHTELWSTVTYAVIVTTFIAVKSYAFSGDLMSFVNSIVSAIKVFSEKVISVGKWCAKISDGIGSQNLNLICYYIITVIVALILAAIPAFIIYLAVSKYIKWYKQEISDHISIWVAVVTLAITIFFADGIKSFLPVNLILLNIIIHLIYSSVRAYIRGCKNYRGYY